MGSACWREKNRGREKGFRSPKACSLRSTRCLERAERLINFQKQIEAYLREKGQMPLPPYIHEKLEDQDRYQTVYAQEEGSAAAPTAGLHFTQELLTDLEENGINSRK